MALPRGLAFDVEGQPVSALLQIPRDANACCVMAHGAGAGMRHPFMEAVAQGLADRQVATLRYQFPYMENGSKRPDSPRLAQATVRAAVAEARRRVPSLPLIAGGKSFGGRMTSLAQATLPLPGVVGLCFLGFPLHAARKPADLRAKPLREIQIPMLFLQGTRDALAEFSLMMAVAGALGRRATLVPIDGGDHSFHLLKRAGRSDAEAMHQMLDALSAWLSRVL